MRKVLEVADLSKISTSKLKNAVLVIGRGAKKFWSQHLRLGEGIEIVESDAEKDYITLRVVMRPGQYLVIGDEDEISVEKKTL